MGLKWPRQGCWEEQQPRSRCRRRLKCRRCRSHRQRRSRRRSVTRRRRDVTAPPPPVSCSFAWRLEGGFVGGAAGVEKRERVLYLKLFSNLNFTLRVL